MPHPPVPYTDIDKVILIKNQADLRHGFAKVTSFVDKGKFYLATMEMYLMISTLGMRMRRLSLMQNFVKF